MIVLLILRNLEKFCYSAITDTENAKEIKEKLVG